MKKAKHCLVNESGFAYIVLILLVVVLGTMGLSLAATTVMNTKNRQTVQKLERHYYDLDGAMTFVQAVLENAGKYGRASAIAAVEDAYEDAVEDGAPLTEAELEAVYVSAFKTYIISGAGKSYINSELAGMAGDERFAVDAAFWGDTSYDDEGIKLTIKTSKSGGSESLAASFALPYHYIKGTETTIEIPGGSGSGSGGNPIGFYNPLFRAAMTSNGHLKLNSACYFDATNADKKTTGIAMQWTSDKTGQLVQNDSMLDIKGTTIPVLETEGSSPSMYRYYNLTVNGQSMRRSVACDISSRIKLSNFYDSSKLSGFTSNSSGSNNKYYQISEGDLILRIYKGTEKIEGSTWTSVAGKRGLIIIPYSVGINGTIPQNNPFKGVVLFLGSGTTEFQSPFAAVHDEKSVQDAFNLYKSKTNSDLLEQMFKMPALKQNTYDTQRVEVVSNVTSNPLFISPLVISNKQMESNGLAVKQTYPSFQTQDTFLQLEGTPKGLVASSNTVNVNTGQNPGGLKVNGSIVWENRSNSFITKTISSGSVIPDVFAYVDKDLLKSWKSAGVSFVARQGSSTSPMQICKIYMGDVTIRNNRIGGTTDDYDNISSSEGLIFVNGKLSIEDSNLNFTGVIIATNGIYVKNSSNTLKFGESAGTGVAKAIAAVNLSEEGKILFSPGAEKFYASVYDGVGGGGTQTVTAPTAGSVDTVNKGVRILDWNTVQ